jgi:hypothetical protein
MVSDSIAMVGYSFGIICPMKGRSGTAAFSKDRMPAAHELKGPNFVHSILTTAELVAALPQK